MKRTKPFSWKPVVLSLMFAPAAMADHNSIWGEGWANMPNDIHDTRVDTLGDTEAFQDAMDDLTGPDTDMGGGSSASSDLMDLSGGAARLAAETSARIDTSAMTDTLRGAGSQPAVSSVELAGSSAMDTLSRSGGGRAVSTVSRGGMVSGRGR